MQSAIPYSKNWAIGVSVLLVILYGVGLVGLVHPDTRDLFKELTSFNLVASLMLVLAFQKKWTKKFVYYLLGVFLAGYLVELLGISSGFPFGEYEYGPTLGVQLWDVPLLIGFNWVILVYCTGAITRKIPVVKFGKAFIGATLMVLMDMVIEPMAVKYDFWSWDGGEIPIQNYIAWFVISFVMLLIFHLNRFRKSNLVAPVLYVTMFLFFILLNYLS